MKRSLTGCLLLACTTVAVIGGCSQWLFDSPLGVVDYWRGPESYRVDYAEVVNAAGGFPCLRRECQVIAERFACDDSYQVALSNLPPVLATLKPKSVDLYGGGPFIIIQTSGGFYHRGLLVSLSEASSEVPPMKWLRAKIAPGVFEYRE